MQAFHELENTLTASLSSDFFEPCETFTSLHKVIDVLAAANDVSPSSPPSSQSSSPLNLSLQSNPAYKALKQKQQIVQKSISHVTNTHYNDLNISLVAMKKVTSQFDDVKKDVGRLVDQVGDVQKMLDNTFEVESSSSSNNNNNNNHQQQQQHASQSLKELYNKKMEAEYVLQILQKLEKLRSFPGRFDALIANHQLFTAVHQISSSLELCFSADVVKVQALSKVTEEIIKRKQQGDNHLVQSIHDVLYLRTGGTCLRDYSRSKLRLVEDSEGGNGNEGLIVSAPKGSSDLLNDGASLVFFANSAKAQCLKTKI